MTRLRWVVVIVTVSMLAFGIVLAVSLGGERVETSALLGKPAPEFRVRDFDNAPLSLSGFRGRVVLLNFWNEWCEPCIQETPDLVALADARRDDPNFAMVGIVHDARTERAAREYAELHKLNYTLAFDPDSRIALDYGVRGQPETFVIDKNGVVVSYVAGPIDPLKMVALLAELEGR